MAVIERAFGVSGLVTSLVTSLLVIKFISRYLVPQCPYDQSTEFALVTLAQKREEFKMICKFKNRIL